MGNTLNPATGKPTFNNTPSTVSDLQAAADYTDRNTVEWVATVTDLELIKYPREGEIRRVRADGSYHGYNGSGWEQVAGASHQQLDTTNSTAFLTTQHGVTKISGVAAATIEKAITFPVAFSTIPMVDVSVMGTKAAGAYAGLGSLIVSSASLATSYGTTTTGTTVHTRNVAGNYSTSFDVYVKWSATGVLA